MPLLFGILLLFVVIAAFINLQGKFNNLQQQLEELKKIVNKDLSLPPSATVTQQAIVTEKAETPAVDNIPDPKPIVNETAQVPVQAETADIKPAPTIAIFSSKPTTNIVVEKPAAQKPVTSNPTATPVQTQSQPNKESEPDLGKNFGYGLLMVIR